jgi:PhnB protein
MPTLDSYLMFNGTCADAMRFYEQTLGGKLDLVTAGQSPAAGHTPPGTENLILHARLDLDGRSLMASDWMDTQPYPGMGGFSLAIAYPEVEEAQRVFGLLADGGKVTMPMGSTFFAKAFGMLVDRFGTPWMVSGGLTS